MHVPDRVPYFKLARESACRDAHQANGDPIVSCPPNPPPMHALIDREAAGAELLSNRQDAPHVFS